jgi:hypothetical protein
MYKGAILALGLLAIGWASRADESASDLADIKIARVEVKHEPVDLDADRAGLKRDCADLRRRLRDGRDRRQALRELHRDRHEKR